jgi:hypothetical protein
VSASAGDPSADWDLIDVDEDEENGEETENKAFREGAENRLIGKLIYFSIK